MWIFFVRPCTDIRGREKAQEHERVVAGIPRHMVFPRWYPNRISRTKREFAAIAVGNPCAREHENALFDVAVPVRITFRFAWL